MPKLESETRPGKRYMLYYQNYYLCQETLKSLGRPALVRHNQCCVEIVMRPDQRIERARLCWEANRRARRPLAEQVLKLVFDARAEEVPEQSTRLVIGGPARPDRRPEGQTAALQRSLEGVPACVRSGSHAPHV